MKSIDLINQYCWKRLNMDPETDLRSKQSTTPNNNFQGMCAITYSAPVFSLSLARGADINLALGNQCTTDYVYIPQGRGDTPAVTADR